MNSIHPCNAANRRSNIHLYPDDWENLPIPDVSPEQQQPIVALVEQILTAKRANPKAGITALESELDHAVALLYGTMPCSAASLSRPGKKITQEIESEP